MSQHKKAEKGLKTTNKALKKRDEELKYFIDGAPVAIAMFDDQMRYIAASNRWIEDYNLKGRELRGVRHYDIFPELPAELKEVHKQALAGSILRGDEEEFVRADGSVQYIKWEVHPWYLSSGDIGGIIIFSEDVSKRVKAEKTLRESEKRYKSLYSSMNEGLATHKIIYDDNQVPVDYVVLDVNPAFETILGMNRREVVGRKATDIYGREEAPYMDVYGQVAESGNPVKFETYYAPMDKYFRINVFSPEEGTFATVFEDITNRKKSEELLRENEEKYRTFFESNPDYTILVALDGVILDVNYTALDFTNQSKEELIGKNYTELKIFPKEDLPSLMENFIQVMRGEIVGPFPLKIINKQGNLSWVETKLVPLIRNDEVYSIMVIATDITARKTATDKLKSSVKEKEALLREIHHRVKNNMQIISSLLNLQKQSIENDEFANILMESQNRIKSMAMIHEKLYLSGDLTRINFSEYIERMVSDLYYSYDTPSRQVKPVINVENLRLNIETAVPCGLIISELVSNSLKHAFPDGRKGTLTVSLKSREEWNELVIADDGIGLPEKLDIKNAKTLGLQLVNNLVNQLDGEITLDRSHGTKFKIIFKELKYKERISSD